MRMLARGLGVYSQTLNTGQGMIMSNPREIPVSELVPIDECRQCQQNRHCPGGAVGFRRFSGGPEKAHLVQRRLKRGEHLFNAGAPVQFVDVVREGAVKTFSTSADGEEQVYNFFTTGDLVAADNLYRTYYSCYAAAASPARVCRLPLHLVRMAQQDSERFRMKSTEMLVEEVMRLRSLLQGQRAPATARVIDYLLSSTERIRRPERMCGDDLLQVTRTDLGRHLGLATETVSRIVKQLQRSNLVKLSGRRVRLTNVAGLRGLRQQLGMFELAA